jgi:hypothetical protein
MAYNPFDFFRRNQKIFFAVLTVFVMFMFVLSFGQGDFFSWFPRWLGSMKSEGAVLAEVNGKKIRSSELHRITQARALANEFMTRVADQQYRVVAQRVREAEANTGKISEETRQTMSMAQRQILFARFGIQQSGSEEAVEQLRNAFSQVRAQLAIAAARSGMRAEDKEALEALATQFRAEQHQLDRALASRRDSRDSLIYFSNMPNRSDKDRMEFLLWLKKADQLGIRYTTEDVQKLVGVEAHPLRDDEILKLAQEAGWDRKRGGIDSLWIALADEFRVRSAQTAVLGSTETRMSGGIPTSSAYDLFDYYRKETTPTNYSFLTVPVEPFMTQVPSEPTEAELKQIFRDYRSIEPDPANPKAGIREPRKIKVEWAEITGKEPYYDAPAMARLVAAPGAYALIGPAAASHKFPTARYDEYRQTQGEIARLWAGPRSNPGLPKVTEPYGAVIGGIPLGEPMNATRQWGAAFGDQEAKLADASVAKPHNVGVLAGLLGGSFATCGSLFTAPVVMTETGYAVEKELRLITGIQAFHFPTLPGLAQLAEFTGADAAVMAGLPQPLPQALVQPVLDQISKGNLRYVVAADDIHAFEKKLAEIMKKDDPAAAQKEAAEYVAKFIKDRGLKTDASKTLRDMHTVADEPALAPLVPKSGQADRILGTLSNQVLRSSFGATLFLRSKPGTDQRTQFEQATGLYAPTVYPPSQNNEFTIGDAKPLTLVWRTEETKAESPREFDDPQVIEKCKRVWKRIKARELARKACDDILADLKTAGDSAIVLNKKLLDAEASLKARFPGVPGIRIIPEYKYSVAKLVRDFKSPTRTGEIPLRPFSLTPGTDDFVYPTQKMVEDLMTNREKPIGTSVILTDNPETTMYVAVVMSRDQVDPLTFRETVWRHLNQPSNPLMPSSKDVVQARQTIDARKVAREEAAALLKAEFGYANESPDLEKRTSDSGE